MPILCRDGAEIHYDVYGEGFPILLFAPGGMRSRIERWHASTGQQPCCDWTKLLADHFCVIAMDQRNAGRSVATINADDGWQTYADDHITLMDRLGYKRFHVLGACIGASFCLKLCEIAPERITSAVLQNPIGLNPYHPDYFSKSFAGWAREQLAVRRDLDPVAIYRFGRNLWEGQFVFSVSRAFAKRCPVPVFLMPGSDIPHPAVISRELGALLPDVEVLQYWKGPDPLSLQQ